MDTDVENANWHLEAFGFTLFSVRCMSVPLPRWHRPANFAPSVVLLTAFLLAAFAPQDAAAQRPFRLFDPFYQDESARRTFHDRYAFTTEISYRPDLRVPGTASAQQTVATSPFGLSFRLEYQLAQYLDFGLLVDAAGGPTGRNLAASWLTLKYYRSVDLTDYAFRLAVDPSSDGRSGFPQMDIAFLYRSPLTPVVSSDFVIGVRRVRSGYSYRQAVDNLSVSPPESLGPEFGLMRAVGVEVHAMMNHRFHYDPAGSNLFFTLLLQGGDYNLVDLGNFSEPSERNRFDYRGTVLWMQFGLEIKRPTYQIGPYLGAPIAQNSPAAGGPDGEPWPSQTLRVGLRFMIR